MNTVYGGHNQQLGSIATDIVMMTLSPDAVNAVCPLLSSSTPNTPPPCPNSLLDSTHPRISHNTACMRGTILINTACMRGTILISTACMRGTILINNQVMWVVGCGTLLPTHQLLNNCRIIIEHENMCTVIDEK